jgi:hypothetical protein
LLRIPLFATILSKSLPFVISNLELSIDNKSNSVSLKKNLNLLLKTSKEKPITLRDLSLGFSGKGRYLGMRFAFGRKSWMPKFLAKKKIPPKVLKFIIKQMLFFIKIVSKITRPRYSSICLNPSMKIVNGILVALVGICLAISPPIPLTSYIASFALFFLGIGLLDDDGIMVLISYPLSLLYIVFVILALKYVSFSELFHAVI